MAIELKSNVTVEVLVGVPPGVQLPALPQSLSEAPVQVMMAAGALTLNAIAAHSARKASSFGTKPSGRVGVEVGRKCWFEFMVMSPGCCGSVRTAGFVQFSVLAPFCVLWVIPGRNNCRRRAEALRLAIVPRSRELSSWVEHRG